MERPKDNEERCLLCGETFTEERPQYARGLHVACYHRARRAEQRDDYLGRYRNKKWEVEMAERGLSTKIIRRMTPADRQKDAGHHGHGEMTEAKPLSLAWLLDRWGGRG